jgi:aryl-alcohol dehydrogenase-like predicted oxidoreductase
MEQRSLGKILGSQSILALGCWSFGGMQWGTQEDSKSNDAINASLESGITHFDTAQGYGNGRSETVLAQALKDAPQSILIATKFNIRQNQNTFTKNAINAAIDRSRELLKRDVLDLLYIHWPVAGMDIRPAMDALETSRAAGRIKSIGVSNFSVEDLSAAMESGRIDVHQLCYNLFWRWPEKDIIPFCKNHGIAVATYSSIAQGILTGKFGPTPSFPEGDNRSKMVLFDVAVWPHIYKAVEDMKSVAKRAGRPLSDLAIRWVAAQPGVSSVIVGARDGEQALKNIQAMSGDINSALLDELTEISNSILSYIPDCGNIFRHYPAVKGYVKTPA